MEKWFSILLPRFGFVSQGRQTWAVESIVLVYGTPRWRAVSFVDECLQHAGVCFVANTPLCCFGRLFMPHNFAHHESTSTRVADVRGNGGHCDPTKIWIMES